eukprot:CAMPEP_0206201556 /NCGR_PEP_ID=MMETSP0166-20121206/11633_1 /ASSEMBLY_ACC=CAM_ASM_000260 /TAXON_ID=95228 /ORGANISM="Vannella robusta, Strain DIVA3 518/3/11/1/6" /LENGTH=197 /DNA_ID=CAMNT_0053620283 /DNA_START=347 /DNA_END=937 /DNA_ORIENTATION=+
MIEEINNSIDVAYQRQVQEMMARQQEELDKQVKLEKELMVQDPYQVPIARSVGRPSKRGPGRPPKRGPGRPPKLPTPSNILSEAQLKMLCKARLDVYHHLHIDQARLTQAVQNETPDAPVNEGLLLLNLFEKGNPSSAATMIAAPRNSTMQRVEGYTKAKLKARRNVKFFHETDSPVAIQSSAKLTSLPQTKLFYTA